MDIQRIILRKVCQIGVPAGYHITRLRNLFRVNHLFRRWVARYLVDTLDKKWFENRIIRKVSSIPKGWDIQSNLETQWSKKSSTLFSAFLLYLNATECGVRCNEKAAHLLFFSKASILKDLKRRNSQAGILAVQTRQVERETEHVERFKQSMINHQERLENSIKKRDAAEDLIHEIDRKYKRKK